MAGAVVVLGVFVADATYRADRLPAMGETVLGHGFALGPGGKGSNQAVAAAKAGAAAHLITRLGDDAFAALARRTWAQAGVTPAAAVDADSHTGSAMVFIEAATGDNAIIVAPGAAARLGPADIAANAALIRGAAVFMTQLEQPIEAAEAGLRTAREAGVLTVLNPAPARPLPDGLLALCDLVTPNEAEAEALTGVVVADLASAEAAARALIARSARAAIITLGAQGALLVERAGATHIPAVQAGPVVETTGAGDAFNGALAAALAQGAPLAQAARQGCVGAGISVTRAGAAASSPTRAEIDALWATLMAR